MVIPRDAVTLENFERAQKGLPPIPERKVVREEPEFPKIENQLEFAKIPVEKIKRIIGVQEEKFQNKDGVRFLGYRLELEMQDSTVLAGWAIEGDAIKIKRLPWVREVTDARILGIIE